MRLMVGTGKFGLRLGPTICVLVFLLATSISWLIPPIQSPDEMSHITRAYMISKGRLLLDPPTPELRELVQRYPNFKEAAGIVERILAHGGRVGGMVDENLLSYIDRYGAMPGNTGRRMSLEERAVIAQMPWSSTEKQYLMPGTGFYLPAIYAPHAIGLAMGRALGLGIDRSYRLARAATLATCIGLLYVAFRLVNPNPMVLAILALPMSMFQMLSPTLDGLTTALAVLTVSLFLSTIDAASKRDPKLSVGLSICVFVLATTRNHLVVLLILPFFVAWKHQSSRDFLLGCLVTAGTLVWTVFALNTTNDPRIVLGQSTRELLYHYVVNPLDFLRVVKASLSNAELLIFYQESFIGILGALDAPLPTHFYPVLWGGLALCAIASLAFPPSPGHEIALRTLLLGAAIASTMLIFLALLITWTPHPASVVKGVQGRYFVVPALLMAYALSGSVLSAISPRRTFNQITTALFVVVGITALVTTLITRYHL